MCSWSSGSRVVHEDAGSICVEVQNNCRDTDADVATEMVSWMIVCLLSDNNTTFINGNSKLYV